MDGEAMAIDSTVVPARVSLAIHNHPIATDELTGVTATVGFPLALVLAIVHKGKLHLQNRQSPIPFISLGTISCVY